MADDLVTVECPRCGAGLDIYRDTASLTCHQCAKVFRVNRRGQDIEFDEIVAKVMEVRSWPEFVSADSEFSQIEQSLACRREDRRQFWAWVHRRRTIFRFLSAAQCLFLVLLGIWVVRDKDPATQATMGIFLGGLAVMCGLGWYLTRNSEGRYPWQKRWPWWWWPNREETARMDALELEIGRLEKILAEKKPPHSSG